MSHKHEIKVCVDDERALIQSLEEMGYEVRTGKHTLAAYQWTMECDISIKKNGRQIHAGFSRQDDGTFKLETDFYGTGINSKEFQEQVNDLHSKHKTENWFVDNGYNVTLDQDSEGNLVVVGERWT